MNRKLSVSFLSLAVSPALLFSFSSNGNPPCPQMPEKWGGQIEQEKVVESSYDTFAPRTQRIEVKHIEAKGIGYKEGYSTVEGFFASPSSLDHSWTPFLDLRGHIFNNGKPAVNAGLGFRYLGSRVYGLNVYYDYRKTQYSHYNQVGFGFETLGKVWDFRLNGYFPVGKQWFQNSNHRELAMKGANAEVAFHALRQENYQIYVGTGPYYFERKGQIAWGGKARVAFSMFNYLRLQLSSSYDSIFHGIVQGEIAFTFSFGGKAKVKPRHGNSYANQQILVKRALQRVDRQEIIIVDTKR